MTPSLNEFGVVSGVDSNGEPQVEAPSGLELRLNKEGIEWVNLFINLFLEGKYPSIKLGALAKIVGLTDRGYLIEVSGVKLAVSGEDNYFW
jgi:hypothetical protein